MHYNDVHMAKLTYKIVQTLSMYVCTCMSHDNCTCT